MWGYVFVFEIAVMGQKSFEKRVAAPSKQMGWVQIASWVACHTLNPPVTGIKLLRELGVRQFPNPNGNECDYQHALAVLCNQQYQPMGVKE